MTRARQAFQLILAPNAVCFAIYGPDDPAEGLDNLHYIVHLTYQSVLKTTVSNPLGVFMRTLIPALLFTFVSFCAHSQQSAGLDIRWSDAMNPEDSLVLEWLKVLQDSSSSDHRLLPAQEGDDAAQTFNNSLVALAFMVKHERERAERVLDFYAEATTTGNNDPTLQNFFYAGEARGFFQEVSLTTLHNTGHGNDRWIGDMAWLLCAYKYYEIEYQSNRYSRIVTLLRDLMVSYYKPTAYGGYIRHGWRKGDAYLHEADGHHEGNIDCFAALRLCGEDTLALNIRTWIDIALENLRDLPLDLYTWRTLAYGRRAAGLLYIPEQDPRYRKTISVRGHNVTGFFHGADRMQQNIWTDGLGHIACAHLSCGSANKGYFYANQLDSLIIERRINGILTHAIPYTANRSGGYDWVDTSKGFTSCAAWYILAKNRVNPFRPGDVSSSINRTAAIGNDASVQSLSPNPCDASANLSYNLSHAGRVSLTIESSAGVVVKVLAAGDQAAGSHTFHLETSSLASGVYFCTLSTGELSLTRSLVILH
jgi:hypothetical protein